MIANLNNLIKQYKSDKESVYNTWFINNEDRLKAFRSIRRGVIQVVEDIKQKKFGNDFNGSSLEFVLSCISEQNQVFNLIRKTFSFLRIKRVTLFGHYHGGVAVSD